MLSSGRSYLLRRDRTYPCSSMQPRGGCGGSPRRMGLGCWGGRGWWHFRNIAAEARLRCHVHCLRCVEYASANANTSNICLLNESATEAVVPGASRARAAITQNSAACMRPSLNPSPMPPIGVLTMSPHELARKCGESTDMIVRTMPRLLTNSIHPSADSATASGSLKVADIACIACF